MDNPDQWPPDIHIFTSSKQAWVTLPSTAKVVPEFYDLETVWSAREPGAPPDHEGEVEAGNVSSMHRRW